MPPCRPLVLEKNKQEPCYSARGLWCLQSSGGCFYLCKEYIP